jgi:hypothetical protein
MFPAQLRRGGVVLLAFAVKQASFVPLVGDGTATVPVPSTVLSWKVF